MERKCIPPNVPVESGSGFGVGEVSGDGEVFTSGVGVAIGVGVTVAVSLISFCARAGAKAHSKKNNGKKSRNERIAEKFLGK
jgi:hypothetical protein